MKKNNTFSVLPKRFCSLWTRNLFGFLPSFLTLVGLILGLFSLRFSFFLAWENALCCIVFASFFDGLDGRVARFLNVASDFGAELDSLADFLCYGVAPAFLIYFSVLCVWPGIGSICALFFSVCSALRLARFNAQRFSNKNPAGDGFFSGLPAPMGGILACFPLVIHFSRHSVFFFSEFLAYSLMASTTAAGILMVSSLPVPSFKNMRVKKNYWPFALIFLCMTMFALLYRPWTTLAISFSAYLCCLLLFLLRRFFVQKVLP